MDAPPRPDRGTASLDVGEPGGYQGPVNVDRMPILMIAGERLESQVRWSVRVQHAREENERLRPAAERVVAESKRLVSQARSRAGQS